MWFMTLVVPSGPGSFSIRSIRRKSPRVQENAASQDYDGLNPKLLVAKSAPLYSPELDDA